MQGRRLPDTPVDRLPESLDDLKPGDYWKVLTKEGEPLTPEAYSGGRSYPSNLTGGVWSFWSPDSNGMGTLVAHTVREHEDGTISVLPGDGSSNSILHSGGAQGKTWHGYIYNGEWRSV